ncbi:DUF488 family protein [Streptomyces sp. AJS327]|uniref:DUF488 domain-containing protein n=1 Tax=Streptomyces sp. AJS327 TaxID=2545265 RepID=UPI0015E05690|nr:DUF488 family protein [Streptomyces sp. AJS327]MBA0050747.1 DUF488 family protein [Streptomyces sp. AJS327]
MSDTARTKKTGGAAGARRGHTSGKAPAVRVRRVYEAADPSEDGTRVLVDRVWPRGLAKADAELDDWDKRVAPSTELRKWYGHDPDRYEEFARRYRAELAEPEGREALEQLREQAGRGPLTLLTATKDLAHAHTGVLAEELRG